MPVRGTLLIPRSRAADVTNREMTSPRTRRDHDQVLPRDTDARVIERIGAALGKRPEANGWPLSGLPGAAARVASTRSRSTMSAWLSCVFGSAPRADPRTTKRTGVASGLKRLGRAAIAATMTFALGHAFAMGVTANERTTMNADRQSACLGASSTSALRREREPATVSILERRVDEALRGKRACRLEWPEFRDILLKVAAHRPEAFDAELQTLSRPAGRLIAKLTPETWRTIQDLEAIRQFSESTSGSETGSGREPKSDPPVLEAIRANNVTDVWSRLAETEHGHLYEKGNVDDHYQDVSFPRGLGFDGDAPLTPNGISGTAYLTGGLGVIEGLEVVLHPTDHPTLGRGVLARFSVTPTAGDHLETILATQPSATLVNRTRYFAPPTRHGVRLLESTDELKAARLSPNSSHLGLGIAVRFETPGQFRIDYAPHEIASRALWGRVEVLAFGDSETARKKNLHAAFDFLRLTSALARGPTPEEESLQKKLVLLENAAPHARADLQPDYESGSLKSAQIDAALRYARVPQAFVDDVKFARISKSHIAPVTPAQSEAYARHGVQGLFHLVYRLEDLPKIVASGGLFSTMQRIAQGLVSSGMSSAEDIDTGGANAVFTRLHLGGKGPFFSPGKVGIYLKPDVLDRLDLYGYPDDRYGSTDRGPPPKISRPLLDLAKSFLARVPSNHDEDARIRNLLAPARSNASERPSVEVTDAMAERYLLIGRDGRSAYAETADGTNLGRPVGSELIRHIVAQGYGPGEYSLNNELMLDAIVPVSDMAAFIVASEADRRTLIEALRKAGINDINGERLESFIKVWSEIREPPNWTPSEDAKPEPQPLDFFVDGSPIQTHPTSLQRQSEVAIATPAPLPQKRTSEPGSGPLPRAMASSSAIGMQAEPV